MIAEPSPRWAKSKKKSCIYESILPRTSEGARVLNSIPAGRVEGQTGACVFALSFSTISPRVGSGTLTPDYLKMALRAECRVLRCYILLCFRPLNGSFVPERQDPIMPFACVRCQVNDSSAGGFWADEPACVFFYLLHESQSFTLFQTGGQQIYINLIFGLRVTARPYPVDTNAWWSPSDSVPFSDSASLS